MKSSGPSDQPEWIRSDEYQDVLASLKLAHEQLLQVIDEPWRWKWVIIALHNALQGTCICALTRTDGTGAYGKKSDSAGSHGSNAEPFVAGFGALIYRLYPNITMKEDLKYGKTKRGRAIRMLQCLRNALQHRRPDGWSIERAGLPAMTIEILDLMYEIGTELHIHRHNRFLDIGFKEAVRLLRSSTEEMSQICKP